VWDLGDILGNRQKDSQSKEVQFERVFSLLFLFLQRDRTDLTRSESKIISTTHPKIVSYSKRRKGKKGKNLKVGEEMGGWDFSDATPLITVSNCKQQHSFL
jgi:hypothetical protein